MVGLPNNFLIRLDPGSDDDEHEVASVDITTKKERYDSFRTIHLDAKVDEDDGEEKWDINGNAGDVWRYRFAAGTRANDNYGGHMEAGDGGKFVERTAVHASDEGYTFVEGDTSFWESFDAWNEQAYRPDSYQSTADAGPAYGQETGVFEDDQGSHAEGLGIDFEHLFFEPDLHDDEDEHGGLEFDEIDDTGEAPCWAVVRGVCS